MVNEAIVSGAMYRLANSIKVHYEIKNMHVYDNNNDNADLDSSTEELFLPQYNVLERLLKENDDYWCKSDGYITEILENKLGCSKEQAEEYSNFYGEYRSIIIKE